MTAVTQALTLALLHFVWQGLAVAFLLWIALFLLRRRSANARYAACSAALLLLVLAPAITSIAVYRAPITDVATGPGSAAVYTAPQPAGSPAAPPNRWVATVQSWALPVWSLGVLLFSIRLLYGCRQIAILRRRCAPAEENVRGAVASLAGRLGLARAVRVLVTSHAESPSVVGWLRPAILLPAATLLDLTPGQLEAVLAHELAHVRRHDYLVNLFQIVTETLLFYHPAVWWTSSRMRHERELCCDDLAVRCCGDALCYARALTKLERRRIATPAMAMGSNGGPMLYRIQRLLGAGAHDYAPSKLPGVAIMLVGLVCLALTMRLARGQEKTTGGVLRTDTTALDVKVVDDGPDGPGIAVDVQGASVLHRVPVEYPGAAWERHIEGTVLAEATLDDGGMVSDARILAGPSELRKAVLQSVLQWHFAPGGAGATRQVTISFRHVEGEQRSDGPNLSTFRYIGVADGPESIQNAEIQTLEKRLAEFRSTHATGEQAADSSVQAKGEQEEYEILLRRFNELRERNRGNEIAGRKLARLEVFGLTEQQQKELLSRLQLHLGDMMTSETIESITKTVHDFDEHLEANVGTGDDGVHVRISLRGTGIYVMRDR